MTFVFCVQDAAQQQTLPAERRAEHPGRRTPQQVLVPQHDGAQRAGQEDRNHSGHSECSNLQRRGRSEVTFLTLILSFPPQILDDLLEMDRVTAHF